MTGWVPGRVLCRWRCCYRMGLGWPCDAGWVAERPTGTVTFLFTDVEGSTRLWEQHPDEMRAGLERHDEILRSAIEGHDGYVFSTAGDAFAAAFTRAGDAVAAAVEAQRGLGSEVWPGSVTVRVRMGLHTGEAQERGGDYFGSALNRAARVMAAGHGGQVLMGAPTASVVEGVDLADLGEHRLKDLSGVEHLFQVCGQGLGSDFAPLRTLDAVPGNLPNQVTSFVGRDLEVTELSGLVRAHQLVTLTGVGGVGKTRLAVQVASEMSAEFVDGVWLVELAPVGDPAAVPDAVATALTITPQAGRSVTDSIAETLAGRRMLVVLDNCEHVLDAAGDLIEAILARSDTSQLVATSREGLRLPAEHLWPVPSLGFGDDEAAEAVELFVQRAQAVDPSFAIEDDENESAVEEICRRLDGIALAVELAAARMVSMTAAEVRDRLGDRFRLLSGSRRGLERHQTLLHAVQWSYDLLEDDERALLNRCSVFADGFDLGSVVEVCGDGERIDEYATLDLLDSLVRKSLITTERLEGRTRYGMLETIRQFGEDQLAATGTADAVRDRHAGHFAEQVLLHYEIWEGPDQLQAFEWVDAEFANLRTGFQWAADQGDLDTASTIAAHSAMITMVLMRLEATGWAEELLEAATAADLTQLPRLYSAASWCTTNGQPESGLSYAQTAVALEAEQRYDAFEPGWSAFAEAGAHMYLGRLDRCLEISAAAAAQDGFAHVAGLVNMLYVLPAAGRDSEAMAIADETLAAARDHGNPFWIGFALNGYGRAFRATDPDRALGIWREGLDHVRRHRVRFVEAFLSVEAAEVEAVQGGFDEALELFDTAIDMFHRAGDQGSVASTLAYLAVFFNRFDRPAIAATIYGSTTPYGAIGIVINLDDTVNQLREQLGTTSFEEAVATGAAMRLSDAVRHARQQIRLAQGAASTET